MKITTIELALLFLIGVPTIYTILVGVPFVPSSMTQVRRMLKAAELKPGMKVYDLGSGDGRLVHIASREYGAEAIGYELSPLVYFWSKITQVFWKSKAKLRYGNFWKQDLSDADVIVCYLLPHTMKQVKNKLFSKMKPGALLISHAFSIKDHPEWKTLERDREKGLAPIWIYKIKEPTETKPQSNQKTPSQKKPKQSRPKSKTTKTQPKPQ
jgi:hypothetical protein